MLAIWPSLSIPGRRNPRPPIGEATGRGAHAISGTLAIAPAPEMPARRSQLDLLATIVMVVLCASWGLNQVAIKWANAGFPPLLQGGLRGLGSAALVLAWAGWRGPPIFRRDFSLPLGALIGFLFAAEFAFIYVGLTFTTASRAVLFVYLSPFVVALGAHLFIPGERLGPPQVIGLLCAFAGMAIAFADGLRLPTHRELAGDAMEVAGALLWGATTVIIKASRLARISPSKVLLYQLAGSALLLPPLSLALGEPGIAVTDWHAAAALAYQTIWVAFATYLAWFALIARYPASRLSAFSFLTPLFGVAAGHLLLGDAVSPLLLAALALVGLGIYLVNRPSGGRNAASLQENAAQ
jgi:drug/metabolite transporter (DMT)-like permease